MTSNDSEKIRTLVAVFNDFESAAQAVLALHGLGFDKDSIELVTYSVDDESPDIETPTGSETTGSSFADAAEKWGVAGLSTGAAAGLVTAVLTGFPGIALGMLVAGGLTGTLVGGVAGIDRAVNDDSVDLPRPEEYETELKQGRKLVVVRGVHDQLIQARDALAKFNYLSSHIHSMNGKDFHEHPRFDSE